MNTRPQLGLFAFSLVLFASCITAGAADCVAVPAGAIGWWRAEDNGDDALGNHPAVPSSTLLFTNGMVGRAFAFNGINDYAYVSASVFASVSNNFTMEMWVFATDSRGSAPRKRSAARPASGPDNDMRSFPLTVTTRLEPGTRARAFPPAPMA